MVGGDDDRNSDGLGEGIALCTTAWWWMEMTTETLMDLEKESCCAIQLASLMANMKEQPWVQPMDQQRGWQRGLEDGNNDDGLLVWKEMMTETLMDIGPDGHWRMNRSAHCT